MNNKKGLSVRIDLHNDGDPQSIWEGVIYNLVGTEIKNLFDTYNEEYEEELFDGTWEDYLEEKNVKWHPFSFDVEV